MTWELFVALVAIVGSLVSLGVTVGNPVMKLNGSIIRLTDKLTTLENQLAKLEQHNDEQDKQLLDHEQRIGTVETKIELLHPH